MNAARPMHLFRYRAANEYTFADIKDNCAWFSKYDALNDPFEGNYINQSGDASFDELIRTLRVACFSATNDNLLMWTHYAANHAGLCLEYKFEDKDFREQCFPVRYSVEQPKLAAVERYPPGHQAEGRLKVHIEEAAKLFLTKSLEWSYEQEHRLLRLAEDVQASGERKRLPARLVGVYLGLRASSQSQEDVAKLLADRSDVPLYRTRLVDGQFKLRFDQLRKPAK